jgi:hypothetical protein
LFAGVLVGCILRGPLVGLLGVILGGVHSGLLRGSLGGSHWDQLEGGGSVGVIIWVVYGGSIGGWDQKLNCVPVSCYSTSTSMIPFKGGLKSESAG